MELQPKQSSVQLCSSHQLMILGADGTTGCWTTAGFCLWSHLVHMVSTSKYSCHAYLRLFSVSLHMCSHTYFVLYPFLSTTLNKKISRKKSENTFCVCEATCHWQFFHLKFTWFMLSECLLHMSSPISLSSLPCESLSSSGVSGTMLTEHFFSFRIWKMLCYFSWKDFLKIWKTRLRDSKAMALITHWLHWRINVALVAEMVVCSKNISVQIWVFIG